MLELSLPDIVESISDAAQFMAFVIFFGGFMATAAWIGWKMGGLDD